MKVQGFGMLALEVSRSTDNMNTDYNKKMFDKNARSKRRANYFIIPFRHTADKSINKLGPYIWNLLSIFFKI